MIYNILQTKIMDGHNDIFKVYKIKIIIIIIIIINNNNNNNNNIV